MNGNENYVNKTFRLKASNVAMLEADANRLGISVNYLIQNSIQRFIEWDRYADSVQMTGILPQRPRRSTRIHQPRDDGEDGKTHI